jgi:predicted ester cyclase
VFNGIGGVSGPGELPGEQLGDVVVWMGKLFPDVHRELHRVNVLGDVVAIEVSIRGTFLGAFETPAGVIQPTGAKVDFPTADFWYLRNGKVEVFDCHIAFTTLFAQLGILPDYASAVAASAPER